MTQTEKNLDSIVHIINVVLQKKKKTTKHAQYKKIVRQTKA